MKINVNTILFHSIIFYSATFTAADTKNSIKKEIILFSQNYMKLNSTRM